MDPYGFSSTHRLPCTPFSWRILLGRRNPFEMLPSSMVSRSMSLMPRPPHFRRLEFPKNGWWGVVILEETCRCWMMLVVMYHTSEFCSLMFWLRKNETITDTIKMLCGYSTGQSLFVVRSKVLHTKKNNHQATDRLRDWHTLQGTNISHPGKSKLIFKHALVGGYVSSLEGTQFIKCLPLVGRLKAFADGWKRPSPSTASSEAFQEHPSSMQVGQEEIHQIHPNHRKVLTTYSGPIINIIKLWESSHFARWWTTRTSIAGLFFWKTTSMATTLTKIYLVLLAFFFQRQCLSQGCTDRDDSSVDAGDVRWIQLPWDQRRWIFQEMSFGSIKGHWILVIKLPFWGTKTGWFSHFKQISRKKSMHAGSSSCFGAPSNRWMRLVVVP